MNESRLALIITISIIINFHICGPYYIMVKNNLNQLKKQAVVRNRLFRMIIGI